MHTNSKSKAFTLIELVIVIFIIALFSTVTFISIRSILRQSYSRNADLAIINFLNIVKSKSSLYLKEFGLLFYVNPITNLQNMVIIRDMTVPELFCDEPDICGSLKCCYPPGETYLNVCDRYSIDSTKELSITWFEFAHGIRVMPLDIFKCKEMDANKMCISYAWNDDELINNNYRTGRHRNFFVVMYNPFRKQWCFPRVIIFDRDKNSDGNGDFTQLPVETVVSETGNGEIHYIISGVDGKSIVFPVTNGIVIYDEDLLEDLPIEQWPEYLKKQDDRILVLGQIRFKVVNLKR